MKKLIIILLAGILSCQNNSSEQTETPKPMPTSSISQKPFGTTTDSIAVDLYTLTNGDTEIGITNYGGVITAWRVPDADGNLGDVVLGYDNMEGYRSKPSYFGALVGRYGNRIAKGEFTLDGETYSLATNNGANHLHGGIKGFDKVVWQADTATSSDGPQLVLRYTSPDGEEGYPGNLETQVTYTLQADNTLRIDYEATTDEPTIINLTNHSYFNLSGDPSTTILDHRLMIDADRYVPVTEELIPTGELAPVNGSPFDFTESTVIGNRIDADHSQIKNGLGYDHCWVLNGAEDELTRAATVFEPTSKRFLEVFTTEPGIQFYSGNFLDGTAVGKEGISYKKRSALCLETEHFPDSPNQPDFPSVVLRPGETYRTTTAYKFSVKEDA
ncbi:MAG: aldose epimerase family protein [Tunicatimonas sp.]|uniref:aldose epimerase family protein n=1 Tax=Tunicatimonas sp. TaxID=1940096 RepID=UPI003C730CCF